MRRHVGCLCHDEAMTPVAPLEALLEHHLNRTLGAAPDWSELDATLAQVAPIDAPTRSDLPGRIDAARGTLVSGNGVDANGALLPAIWCLGSEVADRIVDAAKPHCCGGDRIYVLEFQGPRQLVMFGRTTKLATRLRTHRSNAETFGYALLNGWASPGLADASLTEITCLAFGRKLHGGGPVRERFFDMPFEQALRIARVAFAHHSLEHSDRQNDQY